MTQQQFTLYRRDGETIELLLVGPEHRYEVDENVWRFVSGLSAASALWAATLYMRSSRGRLAFAESPEESIQAHPLGHVVQCKKEE